MNTSRTFTTKAEAFAFMLGFYAGQNPGIGANPDPEEPQTILIDCDPQENWMEGDDAQSWWESANHEYEDWIKQAYKQA